jgi:hypothetical protein
MMHVCNEAQQKKEELEKIGRKKKQERTNE